MAAAELEFLPEALQALASINEGLDLTSDALKTTTEMVKDGELPTQHGLSFLDVKNHALEQYLLDLQFLMLSKCQEASACRPSTVERLIETRVLLEKLRPIETKLRFQIDKTIKSSVAVADNSTETGLLQYKPRLDAMKFAEDEANDDDDEEIDSDDADGTPKVKKVKKDGASKKNIYRPPKILSMPYEEEGDIDKPIKRKEVQRRAVSSRILAEMKEDLLDVPAEIRQGSMAQQVLNKSDRERLSYEESNYMRIPITKQDKKQRAMAMRSGSLAYAFGDITGSKKSGTKKSGGGKKSKGKKGKFKKRK